jgi:peptidyl-prolyl cis-trans isomerase C
VSTLRGLRGRQGERNVLKTATKLAAGLVAFTVTAAAAQDAGRDTVIATVNGVDITLGEMIVTRAQLPSQYQQLPDDVLWEGVLDQLVQQQLLAAQLGEPTAQIALLLATQKRSLMAAEVIDRLTNQAITDEALEAAYNARFANAAAEEEYSAAHILVDTREEAEAVVARLEGGADFAETAKEISTGPSGPNGGDLGWFGIGMMVPEFETAVIALEVGQISEPVQTQFGWHVIILNDKRQKEAPTLDQVRDELAAQIQQEAIAKALEDLIAAAAITRPEPGAFDPAILKNIDLLTE